MSTELYGRAGRIWPLVLILVILGSTSCCVAILRGQAAGVGAEASAAVEAATTVVQHVAFLIIMTLFFWHQRRVLVFLVKLAVRNWAIGAEIVLLLAIIYGAFGSYGVPELFWDDSTLTVGIAAFMRDGVSRAGVVRHLPGRLHAAEPSPATATGMEPS